uniref:Uncharacterized protein n=1 Tax=Candidatus Kentrum sp. UNK TaxID=2126344 RepID=A0A451ALK9_9GAMM|nr:MAG: hypothetical protein BECKUNK1418G_GA0071005_11165 [Candidatus Kentron sp. UNK]VFK72662.1 MAG: hypothetical protein BECKUNK1418H_GA0071006_11293 [Candidatus Kentron sp. UNK]
MPCSIKPRDSLAIIGSYRKEFLEQLANIPSDTRARIEKFVFEDLPGLSSIIQSGKVEKIKSYDTYYKARFGVYRVGMDIDLKNFIEKCRVGGGVFWITISNALLVAALLLSGCASIHIYDKNSVTVTTKLGLTIVQLDPKNTDVLLAKAQGLGLTSTPLGVTLGWRDEVFATLQDQSRCQVLLWIENESEIESILSLLHKQEKSLNNICIIDNGEIL